MAQYALRANLSSPIFPFATEFWGRSIIVPQYDQNYDRTTIGQAGVIIDKGIPQTFYMHNCMPTPQGYQSIGYTDALPATALAPVATATDFNYAFPLQNISGNKFIFVPSAGKNYIYDATVGAWASVSPIAGVSSTTLVTTAFIQGQSYIYYSGIGCFVYNETTKHLDPVTLVGLNASLVLGITASSGYMIAWTTTNIAWSSLITPTTFTPDLTTGAGGGALSEQKGNILACYPLSGGFIAYCQRNAVGARFSGNINFPFIFKEVPGSAGIRNATQTVSLQSNLSYHIVWSGAGIQRVSLGTTDTIYGEATDFLAGMIFEDYDENANAFNSSYLLHPVDVGITIISSRFLAISYGVVPGEYTHALVFDLELNRWGKLKIQHRDCFQYTFPNVFGAITYGQLINTAYNDLINTTYGDLATTINTPDAFKHSFAFLQKDGHIKLVDFQFSEVNADGVLLLGKYQFQRTQRIEHQITEVDTIRGDLSSFQYFLLPSQDGKTFSAGINPFQTLKASRTSVYKKVINAYSLSALFIGAFHLTSVTFTFTLGGLTK